jgi:hypothetical protein
MVEKAVRVNQGDLTAGQEGVHAASNRSRRAERLVRSQSVHKSDEAPVMGVEQRDAGRWRRESQTDGREISVSASDG